MVVHSLLPGAPHLLATYILVVQNTSVLVEMLKVIPTIIGTRLDDAEQLKIALKPDNTNKELV